MKNLRSNSISKNWKASHLTCSLGIFLLIQILLPNEGFGRIYIDINAPSIQKIKIAIPDFKDLSSNKEHPELSRTMVGALSNDLDLSGFFTPIDREAFLGEADASLSPKNIRFKNWTVIGAELLLAGNYTPIGRSVEVEIRLFDVFWGRQIMGKRFLGKTKQYRTLMHQ
ncbi:MAG: hypothetical protein QGG48_04610, partial [Desulfatiglandales bacterium]|nr:hypothetical protein [Desulfatiglandales bacterium]